MGVVTVIDFENKDYRIRFQGKEWVTVMGAICTPQMFANFETSYAHIYPDGHISRFGVQIGTVDDVVVLGEWEH